MQDLTQYSDDELSMQVFNTEYFYVERKDVDFLLALCAEEFQYTEIQQAVLLADLLIEEED